MGFRINTNTSSLSAQRALSSTSKTMANTMEKMASGQRITKAADDAAGLAISEKLKASVRSLNQANRNANDGISMVQVAEGGMNEVSNILIRLRELAIQSASDTVSDKERVYTNMEYQNLKSEVQRIAEVTEFNGTKLLKGEGQILEFQVGINNDEFQDRIGYDVSKADATLESLGINGATVENKDGARDSLAKVDSAIHALSEHRAGLGALQNRLQSTSRNIELTSENLQSANSRIRDLDYADATAENTKNGILNSAGVSVLSQANMLSQNALKLIG